MPAAMPVSNPVLMARLPRLDLPGIPQHIVQRANNRLLCFLDDEDRLDYLHRLSECLQKTTCQLHAYVLMDNHVHLLVTPNAKGEPSRLMQHLGRHDVRALNARHEGRTDTLWEGRYKACLIDSEAYLAKPPVYRAQPRAGTQKLSLTPFSRAYPESIYPAYRNTSCSAATNNRLPCFLDDKDRLHFCLPVRNCP